MKFGTVEVRDFRNYVAARLDLSPGFNLFVGGNGQGKTNLLEAISVLCGQGSHRTSGTEPLVRTGAERGLLSAEGTVRDRTVRVDVEIRAEGGVRMLVNRVAAASVGLSPLSAVLFSPEDLALVKGPPDGRRRFLDVVAARLRPLAAAERGDFDRVLRQRNGALKAAQTNPRAASSLPVWDEQFIASAAKVYRNRVDALEHIGPVAATHYRNISSPDSDASLDGGTDSSRTATWEYMCSWSDRPFQPADTESVLGSAIAAGKAREIDRGMTLVGPQRDDLAIQLAGADARQFASQGEQRSLALALRLAERDLAAASSGEDPILLLDDVFSELDDRRRSRLSELVMSGGQVLATATSADGLPILPDAVHFISGGAVTRP